VDGHKDKVTSTFTPLERLNMRMDTLAKSYWRHLSAIASTWNTDYCIPIYEEGWQLWNGTNKIRDASKEILYGLIQDPITINHWVCHNCIPSEAAELVDWKANGNAFKAMKLGKRRRVSKHACHNCGVGTTLVKWNLQADDACPRCGQSETTEHVI
jgi:ribosomal protein S27AE